MEPATVQRLIYINRKFYQQFADAFDATRQRLQPGIVQVMDTLLSAKRILDLGCGNGALSKALYQRGFIGEYTGIDFSAELVKIANSERNKQSFFYERDLTSSAWSSALSGPFDIVVAFAVFHHLPAPTHSEILEGVRNLITSKGKFILSNWQFLNSPRWVERIQAWENVGLQKSDVGPEDYLLDWRRGGTGFRYIHHFSEKSLQVLADKTNFKILESFYSDGKEGDLALYQIWTPQFLTAP